MEIHKNNTSAFTLIELLVVIAILGVTLMLSYNFFSESVNKYYKLKDRHSLIKEWCEVEDIIANAIHTSKGIVMGDRNKIILWSKDSDLNGVSTPDEWLTIHLDSEKQNELMIERDNERKKISGKIDSLSFYFDTPPPLTKNIIIKARMNKAKDIINRTASITLRNNRNTKKQ